MFFILSKILSFLITPFFWIMLGLLASWVLPKKRKILLTISLLLLMVFTNPWLYRTAMFFYQEKPFSDSSASLPSTAIVLTGMAGFDSTGTGYFGGAADRFIQSAQLLHSGRIQRLIISGGSGNLWRKERKEALFIREQLLKNGIHDSTLLVETESRNTHENAVFTAKLIDSLHIKGPFLLITSALHMPRAKKVFLAAGIPFLAYPCDYRVYPQTNDFTNTLLPNINYLKDWEYLIREWVGTLAYGISGKATLN